MSVKYKKENGEVVDIAGGSGGSSGEIGASSVKFIKSDGTVSDVSTEINELNTGLDNVNENLTEMEKVIEQIGTGTPIILADGSELKTMDEKLNYICKETAKNMAMISDNSHSKMILNTNFSFGGSELNLSQFSNRKWLYLKVSGAVQYYVCIMDIAGKRLYYKNTASGYYKVSFEKHPTIGKLTWGAGNSSAAGVTEWWASDDDDSTATELF